jgi:hypothetical protein
VGGDYKELAQSLVRQVRAFISPLLKPERQRAVDDRAAILREGIRHRYRRVAAVIVAGRGGTGYRAGDLSVCGDCDDQMETVASSGWSEEQPEPELR